MSDNPSAFPLEAIGIRNEGMTLRDYFAGQALASASALPLGELDCEYRAKRCYEMADAMLAARTGDA